MSRGVESILDLFSGISDQLRLVLIVLAAMNLLGFIVVLWDKSSRDRDAEEHVPHPVLALAAAGGGSFGIIFALKLFGYTFKSNAQTLIVVASVLFYIYLISEYKDWIMFNM